VEAASIDIDEEQNFTEAVEYARKVYQEPKLLSEVEEVFDDEHAKNLTKDSKPFWIVVSAINEFRKHEGKGTFPCAPTLPDITTNSASYVKLQEIFGSRAESDAKAVYGHVQKILKTTGSTTQISMDYVNLFIKNLRGAFVARVRSLEQEYDSKTFRVDEVNELLEEVAEKPETEDEEDENASLPAPNAVSYYLTLRAAESFQQKHGRLPGQAKSGSSETVNVKSDVKELTSLATEFYKEYGIKTQVEAAVVQEIVRGGGEEVHNIAAVIGGTASQEALKLILSQYVIANNTILFNGIHGASSTWEM